MPPDSLGFLVNFPCGRQITDSQSQGSAFLCSYSSQESREKEALVATNNMFVTLSEQLTSTDFSVFMDGTERRLLLPISESCHEDQSWWWRKGQGRL